MIDELFLYDRDKGLFKEILKQSSVMEGRYHVSPNYGHDLNTNNLDSFLKDPLYGLTDVKQKYPLCVCMPPRSRIIQINSYPWEQFNFTLFFLCRTYVTGQNKIKGLDKDTNTSSHHVWYDWKDMKELAVNFFEVLNKMRSKMVTYNDQEKRLSNFLGIDRDRVEITRLTKFNNDNLSGVSISFSITLYTGTCELNDYTDAGIDSIQLPELSIHPIHKH